MVSHSEIINDILTHLDKADGHTLSFSALLQTSTFNRRELLYLLDTLEQKGILSHTTDFWGDPKNYTLLVSAEDLKKREYNHL
jgi:DNA-binding IclR family transcriptional regulator